MGSIILYLKYLLSLICFIFLLLLRFRIYKLVNLIECHILFMICYDIFVHGIISYFKNYLLKLCFSNLSIIVCILLFEQCDKLFYLLQMLIQMSIQKNIYNFFIVFILVLNRIIR